jgi:hypothetical protein
MSSSENFRTGIERWAVAFVGSAIAGAILLAPVLILGTWAAVILLAIVVTVFFWSARKLPKMLSGGLRRHPILSIVWLLIGLVAILQMGRLSAFMTDPSRTWGSMVPDPAAISHQCMSAYVQAADLSRRGIDNIYDEQFYPAFRWKSGLKQQIESPVFGLARYLEDAYEYPPPFLLLPR